MKRLIILAVSILFASSVFADNKSDQMEKEIRILQQQVEALENNSLDPIYTANAAEDKVSAFLTLSGYIEMSAGKFTQDDGDSNDAEGSWMDVGVVEFVFDFDFSDQLSATIHVTSEKTATIDESSDENYDGTLGALEIEEANFTWSFASMDGLSLTVGIQDVNPGLEASEAVDLYQYSVASYNAISTYGGVGVLPHYAQGLTLKYENEQFDVSVGVYDNFDNVSSLIAWIDDNYGFLGVGVPGKHDGNIDEFAFLIQGTYKIGENGTVRAAYGSQETDEEDNIGSGSLEYDFFVIYGVYAFGQFEVAAEWTQSDTDVYGLGDLETTGYILRGTLNINDKWSVGIRYDQMDLEIDSSLGRDDEEHESFALSAAVTISDNLSIIAELGTKEIEVDGGSDIDEDWVAIEAFLTF